MSVSLNNGIMTLNAAGSAKLYSYAAGKGVEEVLVYPGVASAVGFSPDSKFIYIGLANGMAEMVRVETLEVERTVGAPGHPVKSMTGSTFGNLLAIESEMIRVYGSAAFSAYVPAGGRRSRVHRDTNKNFGAGLNSFPRSRLHQCRFWRLRAHLEALVEICETRL